LNQAKGNLKLLLYVAIKRYKQAQPPCVDVSAMKGLGKFGLTVCNFNGKGKLSIQLIKQLMLRFCIRLHPTTIIIYWERHQKEQCRKYDYANCYEKLHNNVLLQTVFIHYTVIEESILQYGVKTL